jgi:hypothetical protein
MSYIFVKEGGDTGDVGAPSADRAADRPPGRAGPPGVEPVRRLALGSVAEQLPAAATYPLRIGRK